MLIGLYTVPGYSSFPSSSHCFAFGFTLEFRSRVPRGCSSLALRPAFNVCLTTFLIYTHLKYDTGFNNELYVSLFTRICKVEVFFQATWKILYLSSQGRSATTGLQFSLHLEISTEKCQQRIQDYDSSAPVKPPFNDRGSRTWAPKWPRSILSVMRGLETAQQSEVFRSFFLLPS